MMIYILYPSIFVLGTLSARLTSKNRGKNDNVDFDALFSNKWGKRRHNAPCGFLHVHVQHGNHALNGYKNAIRFEVLAIVKKTLNEFSTCHVLMLQPETGPSEDYRPERRNPLLPGVWTSVRAPFPGLSPASNRLVPQTTADDQVDHESPQQPRIGTSGSFTYVIAQSHARVLQPG